MDPSLNGVRIAIVGLGYVGLPLAIAFARAFPTTGFDRSAERIGRLAAGRDDTREVAPETLAASSLRLTADPAGLAEANVFIVTVPTPIDRTNRPDLSHLLDASRTVGALLKPGDVVVYESTVYPGATEEDCVPVLEAASGLRVDRDVFVGYSPERINPGDRLHTLESVVKLTSGSTPEAADFVDALYRRIVPAGTHKASSIRVAEAAKVIENTQRDLNIALVNELAKIFNRLDLDTREVLEAAGTKWNFLPFWPGLVGGHCIGVDPYYLTHRAEAAGYRPEVILAGRRINDGMGHYLGRRMAKRLMAAGHRGGDIAVLVMGLAFKENCPDIRNSRVFDVVEELLEFGIAVDVHDPVIEPAHPGLPGAARMVESPAPGAYDGIVVAVAHDAFRALGAAGVRRLLKPGGLLYDVKGLYPKALVDLRL